MLAAHYHDVDGDLPTKIQAFLKGSVKISGNDLVNHVWLMGSLILKFYADFTSQLTCGDKLFKSWKRVVGLRSFRTCSQLLF